MADAVSPKLRHVPLPGPPYDPNNYTDDLPPLADSYTLGAIAGASAAVRYVAIKPRCCCGGLGRSSCQRSLHAFTVTTWTLALSMDEPVAWVKDVGTKLASLARNVNAGDARQSECTRTRWNTGTRKRTRGYPL